MCADLALQFVRRIVHIYGEVCKEKKKPTRETAERKSNETRRILTHPKLLLGLPS